MIKILLVEDDKSLGATLHERLQKEGYEVLWKTTMADALVAHSQFKIDLYILDVGLPDGTGFEIAEKICLDRPQTIIFLTAQADAESRLCGYELGAEEYIPKPFHLRELLMRVRHVLDNHASDSVLVVEDVRIDFAGYSFERSGVSLSVAAKDLQLLKILVEASPKVVSRDEALNLVWGEDKYPSSRTVDNAILRLRDALGDKAGTCIESVRGVGYKWIIEQLK